MGEQLFTRCPECQSVFRLQAEQLDLAQGQVRCGACMQVFQAASHLVQPAKPQAAPALAATPVEGAEGAQNAVHSDTEEQLQARGEPDELLSSEPALQEPESGEQQSSTASNWHQLIDSEQQAIDAHLKTPMNRTTTQTDLARELDLSQLDTSDDGDPLSDVEQLTETGNSWLRWVILAAVVLAILVGLALYLWPKRSELAYNSGWSPAVAVMCAALPCELPPRKDLSQLRLQNHKIAPHDTQEHLLNVDLMVINNAGFSQPFPTIEMTFTDTDGKVISTREFRPQDYLTADNLPEQMPSQVPVHIQFATPRPHPDELGFEFRFR